MTELPDEARVQGQQQVVSRSPSNALSTKDISDAFSTVPWIEFNISAKPNHQALAAHPAVQHLVGQTARAALDSIADKVTERIVSSMRGIVESTVKEVMDNDIPHHIAVILEDTFKEHPVPLEPVAVTRFQRLSSRPLGEKSVREQAATMPVPAPATDLAPTPVSAPAPADEVSGEPSMPGSFTESQLDATPNPPPPTTLSDHLSELRKRFVETEHASTTDTDTRAQNSADGTSLVEIEQTADAPVPTSAVEDSDQGVEARPEPVLSDLEKVPGGEASPSPASAPLEDLDGEEKEAGAVVETETQDENDSDVKATQEEAAMPNVSGDDNENTGQAEGSLDSTGKMGDPEATESTAAAAAAEDEVEDEVEGRGEQATAEGVDEQRSGTDLESPRISPEPESPLVPDISSASWIWSANNSSVQENIGTGGARVFRKVAHVPLTVDSVIIDIAFPTTGQYIVYANEVVVGQLDDAHEKGVKVRRFKISLDKPADKVVIAVSAPVEGDVAEIAGSDTGEDSKKGKKAGLILAGVLWMSKQFDGRTYRIKTSGSWQGAMVASGETGFTKAEFNAGWKKVTVVGSYGAEPWGKIRFKDEVGPESEQLAEPEKPFLVSEVAQEGTEGGENPRGE